MSKIAALAFHIAETWRIDFATKEADGVTLPLPDGSTAAFRLATLDTPPVIVIDLSSQNGDGAVVIADPIKGLGNITITPDLQTSANLAVGVYRYEWRIETLEFVSVQAEGRFTVMPSLFVGVP